MGFQDLGPECVVLVWCQLSPGFLPLPIPLRVNMKLAPTVPSSTRTSHAPLLYALNHVLPPAEVAGGGGKGRRRRFDKTGRGAGGERRHLRNAQEEEEEESTTLAPRHRTRNFISQRRRKIWPTRIQLNVSLNSSTDTW